MKIEKSGIVGALAAKYATRLAHAQKGLEIETPQQNVSHESDILLFQKWAYRVGRGWHGFSLGNTPRVWTQILDEFLEWLEKQQPDFEIHQVKMKFRCMKIYLGTRTSLFIPDEKIRLEISKLQDLLTLPNHANASIRSTQKKPKISRSI